MIPWKNKKFAVARKHLYLSKTLPYKIKSETKIPNTCFSYNVDTVQVETK